MVSSATEPKTYPTTVGEVLAGIRSGKWAKLVNRVRDGYAKAYQTAVEEGNPDPAAAAKKAVHRRKLKLPAVTFSGAFSRREDSAIESHSGVLCIDLDNCEDCASMRARLASDPFIQAAFISPSGTGIKALVRITSDAGAHVRSFAAARKHFKDAYGVSIDESCKNLSRLCYVAHDADAFVRKENARLLEPLKTETPQAPEKSEAPPAAPREGPILDGLMVLPKDGLITNSKSAATIFEKISEREPPAMFTRSGNVVTIKETVSSTGTTALSIEDISADAFRSEVEKYGTVFAWRKGLHDKMVLTTDALISVDTAKVLLASRERLRLPPLSMIHRCPILVEKDGKPALLGKGYYRVLGGRYIASNVNDIVIMPIEKAVALILELLDEFSFAEPSDKSRAVAGIITPALRFGGLLRCHFPALLIEADQSQAGKGTLVEIIQRLYGELGGLTAKRKGGVGSFDEDLSNQLLRGRPFIPIDNVRDSLDSEFFEHCLTCPFGATISARVPHRRAVDVDPNRHIFHLTSNKFEATQDLANRSCVVRIKKRPGHKWKTFEDGRLLEAHLEANPWPYLSAVYSIAAQWVARGKQRNENELRGEGRFRELWQVADWIVQKVFSLPPVLDGHEKIQRRVASAGQSWARAIGNLLQTEGMLGTELSASQLAELASNAEDAAGAKIPGVPAQATDAEKAIRVGIIMAPLFKTAPQAEIDVFRITRIERDEERPEHRDILFRKFYVFSLLGGQ